MAFHEDKGGVSDSFHVAKPRNLSPFTPSVEAMNSSSPISSDVSFIDKAPMFCSRFLILVVPGIGHTSFPW